ncbi:MAG: hypothetical protein QNJ38_11465 [Prochloraceae cyanobacterium]|nr:hypothetical protein [Prochloraceae cyanobacterium]
MSSLSCFFCRGKLLRHIKNQSLYWYCCSCRQEVSQTEIDLMDAHKRVSSEV